MCEPILVTLLKMRPHYSQSSRENATPSSGTSPLASYKEVPPREFETLHVRSPRQYWILESKPWIPDSRHRVLDSLLTIPDSFSCIPDSKVQNSGFHKQKFSDFGFPYIGQKWKIQAILIHVLFISKF